MIGDWLIGGEVGDLWSQIYGIIFIWPNYCGFFWVLFRVGEPDWGIEGGFIWWGGEDWLILGCEMHF